MLFTNIQLDHLQPTLAKFQFTLARFIERLEIEGAEEREWIMMGIINIASIMEYGRPGGVLRKVGFVGSKEVNGHGPQTAIAIAMRVQAKKVAAGILESKTVLGGVDEEEMELPTLPETEPQTGGTARAREDANGDSIHDHPPTFKFALQLVFQMLSFVLRHPTCKPSQTARSTLNPYLTIIFTFLATVLKHRPTLEILERSIPWADLASFFTVVPRNIMISQGLMISHSSKHNSAQLEHVERWSSVTGMLTSGCALPLPEDWCLRGMEWVGRKVFETGFWKSGEEKKVEFEVLETAELEGKALTVVSRWVRIIRCGVNIASAVEGFNWVVGSKEWNVEGKLAEKLTRWKEEDEAERLGEGKERRRILTFRKS
jgi:protein SMG6